MARSELRRRRAGQLDVITVRLPSTLRVSDERPLEVHEPVADIAALVDVLDRRIPGFRDQLDDSVFNFAVNDEMLLFRARDRDAA